MAHWCVKLTRCGALLWVAVLIVGLSEDAHAQFKDDLLAPGAKPAVPTQPVEAVAPTPAPRVSAPTVSTPTTLNVAPGDAATEGLEDAPVVWPDDTIEADTLEYDKVSKIMKAQGNAIIVSKGRTLKANQMEYNSESGVVVCKGNVFLERPGLDELLTDYLKYNLKTGDLEVRSEQGDAQPLVYKESAYLVESDSVKKEGNKVLMGQARITTCENHLDHSHWKLKMRSAEMVEGDYLKAKRVTIYLGRMPVLYTPWYHKHLNPDQGWRFRPGYRSRMGAFLLSSYRYRLNDLVTAETHFDYRSERGVALGQDVKWKDEASGLDGELLMYFLNDDKPIDDDEDASTTDIEESRYRVKFQHSKFFTDNRYFLSKMQVLSDTDILEDFFESEHRESPQPENYAYLTHRGENYTALLQARFRANDFFTEIQRLPEARLSFQRQQLGTSDFYYESESSMGQLEYLNAEGSGREDYDTGRLDTKHTLYYPKKVAGFLSVIPRLGIRETYFTKTLEEVTSSAVSFSTVTNTAISGGVTNFTLVSTSQTNSVTTLADAGAELRNAFEIGLETSFKAFKMWDNSGGEARRHVVEPFVNYTFIPDPNVESEDLYQFDEVDTLGKTHSLRLGLRNKMQRKDANGSPDDMIDIEVFTLLALEPEDDRDNFEDLWFDGELRLLEGLDIDFDARYNVTESVVAEFNTQWWFADDETWQNYFELRYRDEASTLTTLMINYTPVQEWTFGIYTRYEMEESRLEEQRVTLQRTYDCLAFQLGVSLFPGYERSDGTERDDDIRFTALLWLTQFPGAGIGSGDRS